MFGWTLYVTTCSVDQFISFIIFYDSYSFFSFLILTMPSLLLITTAFSLCDVRKIIFNLRQHSSGNNDIPWLKAYIIIISVCAKYQIIKSRNQRCERKKPREMLKLCNVWANEHKWYISWCCIAHKYLFNAFIRNV